MTCRQRPADARPAASARRRSGNVTSAPSRTSALPIAAPMPLVPPQTIAIRRQRDRRENLPALTARSRARAILSPPGTPPPQRAAAADRPHRSPWSRAPRPRWRSVPRRTGRRRRRIRAAKAPSKQSPAPVASMLDAMRATCSRAHRRTPDALRAPSSMRQSARRAHGTSRGSRRATGRRTAPRFVEARQEPVAQGERGDHRRPVRAPAATT